MSINIALSKVFPLLGNYSWRDNLIADILASLTLLSVVLPQAIAYGSLTGLPSEFGLYTSIAPVLVYSLLCSSRHVVVGTFALTSLIIRSSVDTIQDEYGHELSMDDRISVTLLLSALSGLFQMFFGGIRAAGIMSKYLLPDSLISGMSAAAGFAIAKSQWSAFFGMKIPAFRYLSFVRSIAYVVSNFSLIDYKSVIIALVVLLTALVIKQINKKKGWLVPDILIGVIIGTILTIWVKVPTIGYIPPGIPSPYVPKLSSEVDASRVFSLTIYPAIKLGLVNGVISMALVLLYAKKYDYSSEIKMNREMFVLGLSTVVSIFIGRSYASCGSLSRTALLTDAGSKSQWANIMTALLVLISLLLLTPILSLIPISALAAVVILAVRTLISNISDGIKYIKNARQKAVDDLDKEWINQTINAFVWWITFIIVFAVEIDIGMAAGILVCVLISLSRSIPRLDEVVLFNSQEHSDTLIYATLIPNNIFKSTIGRKPEDCGVGRFSSNKSSSQVLKESIVSPKRHDILKIVRLECFEVLSTWCLKRLVSKEAGRLSEDCQYLIVDVSFYRKISHKQLLSISAAETRVDVFFVVHSLSSFAETSTEDFLIVDKESILFTSIFDAVAHCERLKSPSQRQSPLPSFSAALTIKQ
ncbi:hypothetical protein MP638_007441 [Amoeboaphelidium occidentale]|nr:hypothetical protein MP638_007441 [Amoeboaphelidium occidentale]